MKIVATHNAGVKELAALNTVIRTLDPLKRRFADQVKKLALVEYGQLCQHHGTNLGSMVLEMEDSHSSTHIQIRKRSAQYPLSNIEVATLLARDIPVGQKRSYQINPRYAEDHSLIRKITAIVGVPEDLFIRSSVVVEDTIDAVLDQNTALLPMVISPALIKSSIIENPWPIVGGLLKGRRS